MPIRTINPPPGSTITLTNDGADPVLRIPQRSGGVMRYFMGLFVLFWLGAWFIGFRDVGTRIVSGDVHPFLILWLGAWTIGGAFALWTIYRAFRPSVPETLSLGQNGVRYDSGVPPFQMNFGYMNQKQAWQSYFPKRTIVEIDREQLKSLRLRETDSDNRLTVDVDSARSTSGAPPARSNASGSIRCWRTATRYAAERALSQLEARISAIFPANLRRRGRARATASSPSARATISFAAKRDYDNAPV